MGLVLAFMGTTGAILAFEENIVHAIGEGIVTVAPTSEQAASPDTLIARFQEQAPDAVPSRLYLNLKTGGAPHVRYTESAGNGAPVTVSETYLDPYTGAWLGDAPGAKFFGTVRAVHRFFLFPGAGRGIGRHVTAIAALSLIFLGVAGIYLRVPPKPRDWKYWFVPRIKARGRALYYSLHSVLGTVALVVYITCALTGLTWAYKWYDAGYQALLAGGSKSDVVRMETARSLPINKANMDEAGQTNGRPPIDPAFSAFMLAAPNAQYVIIRLPKDALHPVSIRYLTDKSPHGHAFSEMLFSVDAQLLAATRYEKSTIGEKLVSGTLGFHSGAFLGLPGSVLFMLAAAGLPFFFATGIYLYFGRPRAKRLAPSAKQSSK